MGATPEPAALASAAHALCDNGYLAEAEALARWLVNEQPHFSGGRVVLGRVLFEMERLDEAADVLRATTIQYPASVAAYRWLGEVLVRQGLWARAKAVLNQAAMLSPANRRISQLQRLAGQEGERAIVLVDDSTTRAMDIPPRPSRRVLPPPIPVQGLSRLERRNPLSEADATPTGIAPPETPLYARSDFGHAAFFESAPWPTAQGPVLLAPSPVEIVPLLLARPTLVFENTPSVTWKGIPVLDQHWKRRWHKGAGWLVALVTTGMIGFMGVRWLATPGLTTDTFATRDQQVIELPAIRGETEEVPNVEQWLHIGSLDSLRKVVEATRGSSSNDAREAQNLASAMLLVDYGVVLAPSESGGATQDANGSDMAVSAQSMQLLAHGELIKARELVQGANPKSPGQPWLALAQARVLQRMGNIDAAKELLVDPTQTLVTAFLAAELALDEGRAAEAVQLLSPLAIRFPQHPRMQALIDEAKDNLLVSDHVTDGTCAPALGPNLFARCSVRSASVLRRKGLPEEASRSALSATREKVTDPRTVAATALVLSNLGHPEETEDMLRQLIKLSGPAFHARTWAEFALLFSRDASSAARLVPAEPPSTPEEQLLFARAAYAGRGSAGLALALNSIGVEAIKADEDLRWWRMLTQFKGAKALNISSKLLASKRPIGPVGSFVAGLLANDSRRLTARWMSVALAKAGHGDRCWAAARFAAAQQSLGINTEKLSAYKQRVANDRCESKN